MPAVFAAADIFAFSVSNHDSKDVKLLIIKNRYIGCRPAACDGTADGFADGHSHRGRAEAVGVSVFAGLLIFTAFIKLLAEYP